MDHIPGGGGPDDSADRQNPNFIDKTQGELAERMSIQVLEATADRVVLRMPVEGNRQPFGIIHGGAYCVLGETAASLAANMHASEDAVAVGIELNASHHRSAASGSVTATAEALTLGRTLTVHQVSVRDDVGRLLSSVRVTNLLRAK